MKRTLAIVAGLLLAKASAADAPDFSDGSLRNYVAWHKMNKEPRLVSAEFALPCAPKSRDGAKGPHKARWINVYMNDPAETHFASGNKTAEVFPPGSIVVKEKLLSAKSAGQPPSEMEAVAGMIKHAPGYNSKDGDWEFFFYYQDGKIERGTQGKLASCADCHRDAATDYVFGDFAKPAAALRNQ